MAVAADRLHTGHITAVEATGEGSDLPAVAQRQLGERPTEKPGPAENQQPHAANDALPHDMNRASDAPGGLRLKREFPPAFRHRAASPAHHQRETPTERR